MSTTGTALAVRADELGVVATTESFIDFRGMPFDQKFSMLDKFCRSNLVPKDYRGNPVDAMIAIDIGVSVGFSFAQSLQSIAVINGRPTIWGDGMIGLVRNSPRCEWIEEVEVGELGTDSYGWRCTAKRVGDPKLITNTFTIRQAKVAKLWTKEGPWATYPERMVKMRARSWTCRDGFADVLKGLAMREEIVDVPPEVEAAIRNAPTRQDAIKIALAAKTAVATAIAEDEPPPSPAALEQAAADVASIKPEPVAETTEQRIEKALDAAAALDPDFNTMRKGIELREYVDGEAAGRNVSPAELRAIETEMPEKRLVRANVREVLRNLRRLALTRMPDAPTDEVPEPPEAVATETPAPAPQATAPHENGLFEPAGKTDEQLDAYVVDYAQEKGLDPPGLSRILAVYGENGRVTHKTFKNILSRIDKATTPVDVPA